MDIKWISSGRGSSWRPMPKFFESISRPLIRQGYWRCWSAHFESDVSNVFLRVIDFPVYLSHSSQRKTVTWWPYSTSQMPSILSAGLSLAEAEDVSQRFWNCALLPSVRRRCCCPRRVGSTYCVVVDASVEKIWFLKGGALLFYTTPSKCSKVVSTGCVDLQPVILHLFRAPARIFLFHGARNTHLQLCHIVPSSI